jgi:ubiquinone/menaquinone biosynthesis C-methylase UbiE
MRHVVSWAILLILMPYILLQVRKPTKWTGRLFTTLMNLSHSSLTDWGLQHVVIGKGFTILDVGCGGGRTIEKLAALAPQGKIYGVDYADGSVAASRGRNARLIEAGRVEIQQASVSRLPFPDGTFDLITAIETQYYWPNLTTDMQEILRVLAPGGTLLIVAESYKNGKFDAIQRPVMKLLKSTHLSVDDQEELFSKAGYANVQSITENKRGWICVAGMKPNKTVAV